MSLTFYVLFQQTEIQAILIEHELSTSSFTQSILSELPDGASWKIEEEELRKRKDLRESHLIYSIDPKGCEDVDDALSVKSVLYFHVVTVVLL